MSEHPLRFERNPDARFVRSCLQTIKRTVKILEVGSAALVMVAYTLLLLTAVVVADHVATGGVSAEVRRVVRWGYLAGLLGIVLGLMIVPVVRRINDLFAARVLERRYPEFKNSLVSVVQLAWRGDLPGSIRAALAAKAAGDLSVVDIRRSVECKALRRAGLTAGGATAVFLIYAALASKPVVPSVRRALGFDVPPPTRTQIVVEEPSVDYETLIGSPVKMAARITGRRPEKAYVRFSTDGGRSWLADQQLPLAPPPTVPTLDPRERHRWRAVKPGRDVQQTMHYQFVAGDGHSEVRLLRVRPYPSIAQVTVRCEYPPYTGLEPREMVGGNVDAVVGTLVTVRFVTTSAADTPPLLTFRRSDRGRLRTTALGDGSTHFEGRFRVEADDEYTIDYRDLAGVANRNSVLHSIRARFDQPPRIDLRQPDDDIALSVDDSIRLVGQITDDFGLTEVLWEYQTDQDSGRVALILLSPSGTSRELQIDRRIGLRELRVKPGQRITWWVAARDNRHTVRNEPAYQRSESERRHIYVRRDLPERVDAPARTATRVSQRPQDVKTFVGVPTTSEPVVSAPDGQGPSARSADAVEVADDSPTTPSAESATRPTDSLEEFVKAHGRELERLREHFEQGESADGGDITSNDVAAATRPDGATRGTEQAIDHRPPPFEGKDRPENSAESDSTAEASTETDRGEAAPRDATRPPGEPTAQEGDTPPGTSSEREARGDQTTTEGAAALRPDRRQSTDPRSRESDTGVSGAKGQPEHARSRTQEDEQEKTSSEGDRRAEESRRGQDSQTCPAGGRSGSEPRSAEGQEASGKTGARPSASGGARDEGRGGSPSQGPSPSDRRDQGPPSAPRQAEALKAGPNSQTGGGAAESLASRNVTGFEPSSRKALDAETALLEPHTDGGKLPTNVDRLERSVDELERQLRSGQADPNLLKALGWTPDQAEGFVREFRRLKESASSVRPGSDISQRVIRSPTTQPGEEVFRAGSGRDTDLRGSSVIDRRDPDQLRRLLEVRRQQVGEDYRDILEAYYKTIAGQPPRSLTPRASQ